MLFLFLLGAEEIMYRQRDPEMRKRSNHFANPVPDMLARFLAWPHVQQPYREFPKLEAKKRETLTHRSKAYSTEALG